MGYECIEPKMPNLYPKLYEKPTLSSNIWSLKKRKVSIL